MRAQPNWAYAFVLGSVAALIAVFAVGVGMWALLWVAVAWLIVAAGYGSLGPRVFGKRADGTLPMANVVVLLPFLLLLWGVWHAQRRLSREDRWHEIAPGLLLGRRVLVSERPEGVGLVIDLTAEFAEPHAIRSLPGYRCLPVLDASSPHDAERFFALVAEVAAHDGRVFVHCANGHGRSALFVVAVLVAKGLATDAKEAMKMVRAARTRVRLNRVQLSWLRAVALRKE